MPKGIYHYSLNADDSVGTDTPLGKALLRRVACNKLLSVRFALRFRFSSGSSQYMYSRVQKVTVAPLRATTVSTL